MGWSLCLNLYPSNKISQTCVFPTFQLWIENLVTRFAVKKMDSGLEPGLDWNLARQRQWEFQGPPVMGPSHTISIRIPLILLLMGEIR